MAMLNNQMEILNDVDISSILGKLHITESIWSPTSLTGHVPNHEQWSVNASDGIGLECTKQ